MPSRYANHSTNYRGLQPSKPRTMTARYAGTCAETGRAIKPGDTIEYDSAARTSRLVISASEGGRYISNVIREKAD